jgi:hypothetical protein
MSVRALNRQSGTGGLRSATTHSIDIVCDSAAGDRLKVKDSTGAVRDLQDGPVTDYAADGAVSIISGVASISKAGACLLTLAAPTAAQAGTWILLTSRTAQAHVLTATTLLADGVSGSPHTTATFGAFIGANIQLHAVNLLWHVVSVKGVTIT